MNHKPHVRLHTCLNIQCMSSASRVKIAVGKICVECYGWQVAFTWFQWITPGTMMMMSTTTTTMTMIVTVTVTVIMSMTLNTDAADADANGDDDGINCYINWKQNSENKTHIPTFTCDVIRVFDKWYWQCYNRTPHVARSNQMLFAHCRFWRRLFLCQGYDAHKRKRLSELSFTMKYTYLPSDLVIH